jgi:anti-sigma factor RsiW
MKWRCNLIQQRLPDYPDGDLSPFWKWQVAAHLEVCPECRQELQEITEVVSLYQAHPLPHPGPEFWQDFDRELHLKLAQLNQNPEPAPRRVRLPHYVLGGTAAMVAALALAVYLGPFSETVSKPQLVAQPQPEATAPAMALRNEPPRAKVATAPAPASPTTAALKMGATLQPPSPKDLADKVAKSVALPAGDPHYSLASGTLNAKQKVALEMEKLLSEDDVLDWDVDSVVVDLSREQQLRIKSKLESRR